MVVDTPHLGRNSQNTAILGKRVGVLALDLQRLGIELPRLIGTGRDPQQALGGVDGKVGKDLGAQVKHIGIVGVIPVQPQKKIDGPKRLA